MTRAGLAALESRQMPDGEKRRRADYVVRTGLGKRHSLRALAHVVKELKETGKGRRCARSCSTPKRRGWMPPAATASSRSPRSS
jgi:dephospho-CoA kinase